VFIALWHDVYVSLYEDLITGLSYIVVQLSLQMVPDILSIPIGVVKLKWSYFWDENHEGNNSSENFTRWQWLHWGPRTIILYHWYYKSPELENNDQSSLI
jgi:hypothetical protein